MATDGPSTADVGQGELCPHPDCERTIAPTSFCCLTHWKALDRKARVLIQNEPRESERLRIAGDAWFPNE